MEENKILNIKNTWEDEQGVLILNVIDSVIDKKGKVVDINGRLPKKGLKLFHKYIWKNEVIEKYQRKKTLGRK